MATYEELVNSIHRQVTGGAELGKYPDSIMSRLIGATEDAWDLVEAAGKANQVKVIAGSELGPWTTPTGKLDDVRQQVMARWRYGEQSRPRTMAETAAQLEELVRVLTASSTPTTPPPTTPPPATSIVPSTAKLFATLDYESGDLSQWGNLQTKDRNGAPGSYSTWRASVRDGGSGHSKAARFEVRPGDVPDFGGGERSEVRAFPKTDVKRGDEAYYVWSMRLGEAGGGFPGASGWGLIVMQWHSDEGSPPLSIHAEGGKVSVQNDRSGGYTKDVCPIDPGNWHDYVLRVKWASDSNGLIEMWRDGQKLLSHKAANCVGGESNYLKQGIYRSASSSTHVVWHDNLRIYKV